jgi:acyl-coenzyme A thioesterase PaaI-like protein
MNAIPFQDQYLDARADCWGCGRNNPDGLYIKSFWEGDEAVAHYHPKANQTGHKGVVNGGVLATLVDCHCMGLAMAYAHREEGREIGTQPLITYVTASLRVNYLKPTPLTEEALEVRAHVERTEGRKTYMSCSIYANGVETVRGEVLGIRIEEPPEIAA